jgi:hypothetical protein
VLVRSSWGGKGRLGRSLRGFVKTSRMERLEERLVFLDEGRALGERQSYGSRVRFKVRYSPWIWAGTHWSSGTGARFTIA